MYRDALGLECEDTVGIRCENDLRYWPLGLGIPAFGTWDTGEHPALGLGMLGFGT